MPLDRFVLADSQLRDVPYLTPWQAANGRCTAPPLPQTRRRTGRVALLTQRDPEDLHMQLCPALAVLPCQWPVVTLLHAHGVAAVASADLPTLSRMPPPRCKPGVQTAVVWREGWRHAADASPAKRRFSMPCNAAKPCQALTAAPDLDFGAWLSLAVRSALLCAVVPKSL